MVTTPHDDAEEPVQSKNSPERLVIFTDAVVAIALTLLVLPLTDIVPALVAAHGRSIDAITGHQWQIRSFLLSFVVIARQWMSHHRLFAHVIEYSGALVVMNLAWLLTVVIMPFPTEMVGALSGIARRCRRQGFVRRHGAGRTHVTGTAATGGAGVGGIRSCGRRTRRSRGVCSSSVPTTVCRFR
jgi:Endosomal/lysosomal potassium channel TMEM175